MKVLVTGATGFVGNHVILELLKSNNEVIATSRNKDKAKQYSWFCKVNYIPYNINQKQENVFDLFSQPDCVIHLAWEGLPNYEDLFHFEHNLPINYHFLKCMIQHGLEHLVVIGTCLEYGMKSGCLSEDIDTNPSTPYGLAKDTLRKSLEQLIKKYPITFQWARLFYLYGKGQSSSSILSQLDSALNNGKKKFNMSRGEQLRDYLPAQKAAEYIVKISTQSSVQGIINCCSGTPISIRSLVESHLIKRGQSIKLNLGHFQYPPFEPMAFWGDNHKLKKII